MGEVLAEALLPATAGEWIQGWIGGREALVSLVVDWRGSVKLRRGEDGFVPRLGSKALEAFALARQIYGETALRGVFPEADNPLPRARGFATSTMDIAGVLAVSAAHAGGARLSEEELFSLCASIEPSDGIMFEGLALVDHLNGRLLERLPRPPDMELLVIEPERTLDTAEYRNGGGYTERAKALASEHEQAYILLRTGLQSGNARLAAEAASISAALQQEVLQRDEWSLLLEGRGAFGALGFAVAHSGTASALIFASGDDALPAAERWLAARMQGAGGKISRARAAGGGVSVLHLHPDSPCLEI